MKSSPTTDEEAPAATTEAMMLETGILATDASVPSSSRHFSFGGCCLSFIGYIRSIDFLELILCLLFAVLTVAVPFLAMSNYERPIPYQTTAANDIILNLELNHELKEETISDGVLMIICVVVPILFQFFLVFCKSFLGGDGDDLTDLHKILCVYSIGLGLTSLLVEVVKNYAGYLRPNFYELCQPDFGYVNAGGTPFCKEEDMTNGYKSFPSGHASTAFAGLTPVTLYLLRNFGVNRSRSKKYVQVVRQQNSSSITESEHNVDEEVASSRATNGAGAVEGGGLVLQYQDMPSKSTQMIQRLCSILYLLPMALAFFIAASRIRDNYHFPADVVAGGLIGFSCSSFAHGLWFPSFPQL